MRSFEERLAEIDRRSEKIVKARKRRRTGILAVCLPLAVCIGIAVPTLVKERTRPNGQYQAESYSCAVAEIRVSGPGLSRIYRQEQDILHILAGLDAYENSPEQNEWVAESDGLDNSESSELSISAAVYTITVTMGDGQVKKYRLEGCALEDLTVGKTYALTKAQRKELAELLGIGMP